MRALWSTTKGLSLKTDTQTLNSVESGLDSPVQLSSSNSKPRSPEQIPSKTYVLSPTRNRQQHSPTASTSMPNKNIRELEISDDSMSLPFASSAGLHTPDQNPMSPVSASDSLAQSSLFGSRKLRASTSSETTATDNGALTVKDDMVLDLLSSQAMLESKEFAVLSWDELESVKRVSYHTLLECEG